MTTFCFCGRLGKPQFMGKCARHAGKDTPKKRDKIAKFRGDSKFQRDNGMFENK